ncbi:MAG: HEAT repeat domain-containing protein [Cyanobacteria bacterium P01_F01_bin.33]
MPTSEPKSPEEVAARAENDLLLKRVQTELAEERFDTSDRRLIQRMVEGLGDGRGLMRMGFAEALGVVGIPASVDVRAALLHHPDPIVRRASGKTLTLIADSEAVPDLMQALLTDDDTVVKGSAAGALAATGEPAVTPLLEILGDPNCPQDIKGHASWALSFMGDKAANRLYTSVASKSIDVRCAAVAAIAGLAQSGTDPKAYDVLVTALSDSGAVVRTEAVSALGTLGDKAAVKILLPALSDDVADVRKAAALSLMKLGDARAIEPLKAARDREVDAALQPVLKLAITQLERQGEADDWD